MEMSVDLMADNFKHALGMRTKLDIRTVKIYTPPVETLTDLSIRLKKNSEKMTSDIQNIVKCLAEIKVESTKMSNMTKKFKLPEKDDDQPET